MKHLNFLSKSSSQSMGHNVVTLASTVGSPSAHRRGIMLKLLSVLVLVLTIGVGNVWGADKTWKWTASAYTDLGTATITNKSISGNEGGSTVNKKWDITRDSSPYTNNSLQSGCVQIGSKNNPENITISSSDFSGTIKSVAVECASYNGAHKIAISVGGTSYLSATATSSWQTVNEKKGTGSSKGTINIAFTNKSRALYIKSIEIVYNNDATPVDPTITPTNGEVEVGHNLDVSTLFESNSTGAMTYSITAGGSYASLSGSTLTGTAVGTVTIQASQAAATGYNAKTATCTVNVIPELSTITITQNEIAKFTNSYAQYTWTAGGVSGKIYAYKNNGMQLNSGQSGYYVYNTDPIPGKIRKITMTKASGTTRSWTPYVSTNALTSTSGGTALTAKNVESTTTWDVTGDNTYFYLTLSGGATVIGSIVIYYEGCTELGSINGSINLSHF